ncbi:uncharacterized protein LOC117526587 [Thalassophryne amazonica]|uniref:uncharacterized protein LOC117526587 n=1 Tax=Thalassophryne amazonica TaxID=390379 RepID=UPI0014710FD0|nr:uncharacterized protein LOC117526587 [Thalassophryne amazonica]
MKSSLNSLNSSENLKIKPENPKTTEISLFITNNTANLNNITCPETPFNPYKIIPMSSSCSRQTPLSCVVGEVSHRFGNMTLGQRQLFTDSIIQLGGDSTVVLKYVLLKNRTDVLACAAISPESPSATQRFPIVANFSRYKFRDRVSQVLKNHISRITILSNSPFSTSMERCQEVRFMVSGEINQKLLDSVKTNSIMGEFIETPSCNGNSALMPGSFLIGLLFVATSWLSSTQL